jgi:hypothetical protein
LFIHLTCAPPLQFKFHKSGSFVWFIRVYANAWQ